MLTQLLPVARTAGRSWPPAVARLRLALTCLVAATLLSGCVVRIVYNQLDWLALWYVEDYFDLEPAQEAEARQMISRTIRWHRETQLPRYAEVARTMAGAVGSPVEPAFLASRYVEVVGFWDDLLVQVAPDFARLLQSLNDRQVEDLFANLAEENEELAEEYSGVSRAERRAKQDKAIIKAFRRFTGRLGPEQETLVRSRTAMFHDLSADWLRRRAAWQAEFRQLMAGRRSDPLFVERVADLMLDPNQFDSANYRRLVLENQQASFSLVAAVINGLSARQSTHLRDQLTTYANDFELLIRDGRAVPASGKPAEEPARTAWRQPRAARGADSGQAVVRSGAEERT